MYLLRKVLLGYNFGDFHKSTLKQQESYAIIGSTNRNCRDDNLILKNKRGEGTIKLVDILNDKCIKKMDARKMIVERILNEECKIEEINASSKVLKDNKVATILEAVEEISNKRLIDLSEEYLEFAKRYVSSHDNSCKREASRIVGNLAARYPEAVHDIVPALLENTKARGTVVRWGSAYALSRIIVLEEYRGTDLFERLISICESEQENGVKNQYIKALKKVKR